MFDAVKLWFWDIEQELQSSKFHFVEMPTVIGVARGGGVRGVQLHPPSECREKKFSAQMSDRVNHSMCYKSMP